MKKIKLSLFSILMLLLCSLPIQTIKAGDVPLKEDNPYQPLGCPNTSRAPIRIALEVTQNDADVTLNFLYPVGVAQISIENENGDPVYQETVDSYSTLDVSIDTQNLDGGVYTLKISYGSTNLAGEFEL